MMLWKQVKVEMGGIRAKCERAVPGRPARSREAAHCHRG